MIWHSRPPFSLMLHQKKERLNGSKILKAIQQQHTRGNRVKGCKILYKSDRHCQHKRKKSSKYKPGKIYSLQRDKKTECPAHFTIKVHNTKACHWITHPCEVTIIWDHNHSTQSAHALSFRPISTDTKQKFYSYFDLGHSPSFAIHHRSLNLAIEHDSREKQFEISHADRSINPLPNDISSKSSFQL